MSKNSIEEDIKIIEKYLSHFKKVCSPEMLKKDEIIKVIQYKEIQALQHILADYKKVLKENEELKETYKSEKKMKNEYVKLYQDLLLKENVISIQKIIAKEVVDILKQILQELLESEEKNDKNNKKG